MIKWKPHTPSLLPINYSSITHQEMEKRDKEKVRKRERDRKRVKKQKREHRREKGERKREMLLHYLTLNYKKYKPSCYRQ